MEAITCHSGIKENSHQTNKQSTTGQCAQCINQ